MNLRARIYVENQKKDAQAKLEARLAFLKGKGLNADAISQDATWRKIKGLLRKANSRMASIVAQEKLNEERVRAKAEKLAAEKAAREKPEKEVEEEVAVKKSKKEKKEKKEKPPKQEKQGKPEQKKGKEEKKEGEEKN
jgi:hypothetical protein